MRLFIALLILAILLPSCHEADKSMYSVEGNIKAEDTPRTEEDIQAIYDEYFNVPKLPGGFHIKPGRRDFDRIHVNNLGNLAELFNDSNKYQYEYAERLGITPITGIKDAYHTSRPLVEISTNPFYVVDPLTHSVPFLVPEAAILLRDIGRNFIDSLGHRGADGYRIIVTSVLRTPQSVKSLRRINRNATDSSTHKFGTTFDITYSRFACADSSRTIHDGDLKNLLAEVLNDLRQQKRCMVKFERKSPCFHITVTR
ncbi:MAG: DUF5715 family protein [Prevotella sp.]|nr:DUF5715 family protein [Bacteroides sp.]MCM1366053.1 DUF5715 family protein [Prevotella sp.]MCM1436877.1 DUF5715 family protein [Prevotella sp.]